MRFELKIPVSLDDVAHVFGTDNSSENHIITHVSTDSRSVEKGDLFFALRGERFNGNEFIPDVKRKGAYSVGEIKEATFKSDDSIQALLDFAAYYKTLLKELKFTVAITGSVGKTTTKEILSRLLSTEYKVHKTADNQNNAIGAAYTILSAPEDTEVLVLEFGMNHKGEISQLSKAVKPNIAVITNIGTAHIGYLGSREDIAEAKLEIRDGLTGTLIIPYGEILLPKESNTVTFSSSSNSADIFLDKKSENTYGLYCQGNKQKCEFRSDAQHIFECISGAASAAYLCNISFDKIKYFDAYSTDISRQKLVFLKECTVIDDSYNASAESFISGIKYVNSLKEYSTRSILAGDILELGAHAYKLHCKVGEFCAKQRVDKIYAFGIYSSAIADGALNNGFNADKIFVNDRLDRPDISAYQIFEHLSPNEVIYAKASHAVDLSRVIDILEKLEKKG